MRSHIHDIKSVRITRGTLNKKTNTVDIEIEGENGYDYTLVLFSDNEIILESK